MHIEIPVCKRCCFCIPLRCGLIIWGCFNLFIGCLLFIGSNFAFISMRNVPDKDKYKITTEFIVISYVIMAVGTIQVILSVIFIIGCHKKNVKLMKTFYYYNILLFIVTSILTLVVCTWTLIVSIKRVKSGGNLNWYIYVLSFDIGLFVANFFFQVYILLVARSEIMKLSNDCQFRFVNVGNEAECTIAIQDSTTHNGTLNNLTHQKNNDIEKISDDAKGIREV